MRRVQPEHLITQARSGSGIKALLIARLLAYEVSKKTGAAGEGQGTHVETYLGSPRTQASQVYRLGNVIKGFNGGFIRGWEANLWYPTGNLL